MADAERPLSPPAGASARRADPLPPQAAYYLRHLLRGEYALVRTDGVQGRAVGRDLTFTTQQLSRLPDSRDLIEAAEALGQAELRGRLLLPADGLPALELAALGHWRFRAPRHGRSFVKLKEIVRPRDVVPARSRVMTSGGVAVHRHLIPLRWHRHAQLVIEVATMPRGDVKYDCWALRRDGKSIAVPWTEAVRLIELFRDMAASYLRVEAATRNAAPAA